MQFEQADDRKKRNEFSRARNRQNVTTSRQLALLPLLLQPLPLPQWSPGHRFPTIKCWHNKINSKTATKRFSQIGGKCKQTDSMRMKKSTSRKSQQSSVARCLAATSTSTPPAPSPPAPPATPLCRQWSANGGAVFYSPGHSGVHFETAL